MKNQLLLVWVFEILAIVFSMAVLIYFFIFIIDTCVSIVNDSAAIFHSHHPVEIK